MNMNLSWVKEWMVLGAIGIAISVVIGYYGVYVPKHHEVALIREQSAQQRLHQETETEVAALLEQVERYHKRLPEEVDPSWLVKQVMDIAERDGVQLTSIVQGSPEAVEQFTRLAVNLQFNASYHQLGGFLDDIERAVQFIRIEQLQVDRPDIQGVAPIQLTISTLFLPLLAPGVHGASGQAG